MELLLKDEVYAVIGAAIEVHKELGSGFSEPVYQEAMEMEIADRHINFEPQQELSILYKGRRLDKTYIPDLICFNSLIVELKALTRLTGVDEAQVLNYLKATGYKVGVLINFGALEKLEWKRFVK